MIPLADGRLVLSTTDLLSHLACPHLTTLEREVALGLPLLPVEARRGLALLPEPDDGDLFLDLEGDPFYGDQGLEYL